MTGSSTAPDQLFVGGTGRCGTNAIGRLLSRHPRYQRILTELRFHADAYGLPGLLQGKVDLDAYMGNLRGRWWKRTSPRGHEKGLFERIPEKVFTAGADAFERDFPNDPWGASTKLIHDLIDPQARRRPAWVELTNRTVEASPVLCRLLPDCKVIHTIRDGRDCASSATKQAWGTTDLDEALIWWEARLSDAEKGSSQIEPDRLLVIDFQDFVSEARDETYDRLLTFTGVTGRLTRLSHFRMHRYYGKHVGGHAANIERWREGLSEQEQGEFTGRYCAALERLIAIDGPARPVLERWLASTTAG